MPELLIDTIPLTFTLEESKEEGKLGKVIARGEYARSDKATENKRLYRHHLWNREIGRLAESMKNRRTFGELDHPADGRTKLQRVSHILTSLKVEGNSVVGESEILDTPNGRILKTILEAGAQVGVSSRGFGSTKQLPDGTQEVQEDFRLDTFDFVADPATKTAYPQIFHEERQLIPDGDETLTLETLRQHYPGLVEEMTADAVSEAEQGMKARLRGEFAGELRRKIEQLDEDVEERVRSELLSDPEVAGAKLVLERIAGLVTSFVNPQAQQKELDEKDEEITKLKGDLAEQELEAKAARREAKELGNLAKEAAYLLHMERRIGSEKARNAIVKLVGDVKQYESKDALDERIDAVLAELQDAKDEHVGEEDEAKNEILEKLKAMEERLQKAEQRATDAEAKVAEANNRTERALDAAEKVQVEAFLRGAAEAHPEGSKLLELCEGATSVDEVGRIMESFDGSRSWRRETRTRDTDEAERIRARVGRGQQRSLEEDTFGGPQDKHNKGNGHGDASLEDFGLTEAEFDELAGTTELNS